MNRHKERFRGENTAEAGHESPRLYAPRKQISLTIVPQGDHKQQGRPVSWLALRFNYAPHEPSFAYARTNHIVLPRVCKCAITYTTAVLHPCLDTRYTNVDYLCTVLVKHATHKLHHQKLLHNENSDKRQTQSENSTKHGVSG